MFYDDRNLLECFDYESQESSSFVISNPPPVTSYQDDFVEKIFNEASSSISSPAPHSVPVPQFYPQLSSQMYNVCPPNITITTREPIPPLPPPPALQSALPDVSLSFFDAQTPTPSSSLTSNANVLNWMKGNDESTKNDNNKSIKELLSTPDIINNQCSSYTKSLYSMKGFARDFQDFRTKLHLSVSDISQRLSHLYGQALEEKSISDFEDLLMSPDGFEQVKNKSPISLYYNLFSAKNQARSLDAVSEKD